MEGSGSGGNIHLGVNKISKVVVKRNAIHHTKQQQQQQQQPAAVYNIDKSDFRDVVQKLTGSPATETPPVPAIPLPPPNPAGNNNPPTTTSSPKPPNPRLHRVRPPPLEPVFSFNKLVPNPAPLTSISFPARPAFRSPSAPSPPLFSPLPPLTPGDEVWANTCDSPNSNWVRSPARTAVPPHHMTVSSGTLQMPQPTHWSAVPSQSALRSPLLPSPAAQFSSVSSLPLPLPSPSQGYGFAYPQGSHIPFSAGSLFPLSPSSQFGFAGGTGPGPLPLPLPLSPGSLFPFP